MKSKSILWLAWVLNLIFPFLECCFQPCSADDRKNDTDINVATYPEQLMDKNGRWEENKAGKRAEDILIAHGISLGAGVSMDGGTEINVPLSRVDQARELIAEAVRAEGLQLWLNEPNPSQNKSFQSPDKKFTIIATSLEPPSDNDSSAHWAQLFNAGGATITDLCITD
jgi:hypothetical protein